MIYPRKLAQKPPNFETHPTPDTTECTINFVPKDIVHEGGSSHKTNQQNQYVDFRRVRNFIEMSDLLDQSLP